MPGYVGAAQAGGARYYFISSDLYNKLGERVAWASNLTYLKDAYHAGSRFVIYPDHVVQSGAY